MNHIDYEERTMSDHVDEVVARMRRYVDVERVMGAQPDDVAVACCDVLARLYIANNMRLTDAQMLLANVWDQNKLPPVRLVTEDE